MVIKTHRKNYQTVSQETYESHKLVREILPRQSKLCGRGMRRNLKTWSPLLCCVEESQREDHEINTWVAQVWREHRLIRDTIDRVIWQTMTVYRYRHGT